MFEKLESLERLEDRFRQESSMIAWASLTIFGGGLLIAALYQTLNFYPWYSLQNGQRTIDPVSLGLLILVATVVLMIYSILASHLLPQKRFVSPFLMSLIGAGVNLFQSARSDFTDFVIGLIGSLFLIFFGLMVNMFAWALVGPGFLDSHKLAIEVEAPFAEVLKKVNKWDLRDSLDLTRKRVLERGNLVLYRTTGFAYCFYVVLTPNPDKAKSTLMYFEAYELGNYAAGVSPHTKRTFERDTEYLQKVLRDEAPKFGLRSAKYDENFPFYGEIRHLVRQPTESKLSGLATLPKQTIGVLAGIAFLSLSYYLSYISGQVTQAAFGSAILGVFGLFVGLLPFLRGPERKGKWTED